MINEQLLNPRSIVIVGGSDDISKPGGKVLKNILDGGFKGALYVTNPKSDKVQGIVSYRDPMELPDVDLAIVAVAAKYCPDIVELLAEKKGTRAFIILSAGFGEESKEGGLLEKRIVRAVESVNGCLIGPNCIGVLTTTYNGVFTLPVPDLKPRGVDFISGSGATAVFIMESAIPNGISFSSVFSVGNSAQTGVEDVLKYLDETYVHGTSSPVKLLYIESITKPALLLKHASSLARKGCRIAAIKAGTSEAGSRAASSHTGALSNPDVAVDGLFRKAGIVRCHSRQELATVASVMLHPPFSGKNIAIVTHAGGPAVMMTDALSSGGLNVPPLKGEAADRLLDKLFAGSSVANPIDFLATGTAEQMGHILDACENDFSEIDAIAIIFGSSGLFPVNEVYSVIDDRMRKNSKPIFPVLPSLITAGGEVKEFLGKGRINFPDEVVFAEALCKVINVQAYNDENNNEYDIDIQTIRRIIDSCGNGYIDPVETGKLLDAAGIKRIKEGVASSENDIISLAERIGYPLVMKVVGPVHKSDVGGVVLDVNTPGQVKSEYKRLMNIPDATGVMIQPMAKGIELFAGAKREDGFGHIILCGLGGIFIEVLKDISSGLAPVSKRESKDMIKSLRGYKILEGTRGQQGVDVDSLSEVIVRLSLLVKAAPEIFEMDLNPLLGDASGVVAVDARIRIER